MLLKGRCDRTPRFVFTWPFQPRYDEPLMTQAGRHTVSLVVIVVQLLCFITFGAATTSIDEVLSDEGIGLNMLMGLVQVRGTPR